MNNIEQLMQTAGVTQIRIKNECQNCAYNMEECGFNYCEEHVYPNFTAEKQLEIIMLIMKNTIAFSGMYLSTGEYELFTHPAFTGRYDDFTQALAQLTTELMKVGHLDKEKVKGVLQC